MSDQRDGGIAWCDQTWNPIRGCSRVSEGCRHCYAEGVAARFSGPGQPYEGLALRKASGPAWTGEVRFVPEHLADPLRWTRPRRVFVNSMSDLFHEKVTDEQIAAVWAVMLLAPHHTFQVLTKRPDRMLETLTDQDFYRLVLEAADDLRRDRPRLSAVGVSDPSRFPARWIWLGVSCEHQKAADERVPLLLQTPAAVRFVSAEPLLGPIDFHAMQIPDEREGLRFSALTRAHEDRFGSSNTLLDWVIVGGESGPGARMCDAQWVRSIVRQCEEAGTSCFVKQLGAYPFLDPRYIRPGESRRLRDRKGGDMSEWPADLRVRQFPQEGKVT